jgi:transcriptional regulator with XRE-family HTH domain
LSESVGVRVRQLREAAGWSQIELGERAGLSNQVISRIEGARVEPKLSSLEQIAKALGTSVGALIDGTAEKLAG